MNKLTVRRLTKLADYMEKLPKSAVKHFDMGSWFEQHGEHSLGLGQGEIVRPEHYLYCGTTACALGWGATMPAFRKAGLKVFYYQDGVSAEILFKGESLYADNTKPFLDLSEEQSMFLFGTQIHVKTPKEWARRCRKFLRKNT